MERAIAEIVRPTVAGMAAEGTPYRGVLYAGLMLTQSGPQLLEYNVRFGDPECQALLPRLMTDLGQLLQGGAAGVLGHMDLRWYPEHVMTVVMAARGYPGPPERGTEIRGVEAARAIEGVEIFHAGSRRDGDRLIAEGGRVLNITARGRTVAEARDRVYAAIARIAWPEGFCRRDIGWRAVAREQGKL
jgi:phosphoribosylamine--glycine ligase